MGPKRVLPRFLLTMVVIAGGVGVVPEGGEAKPVAPRLLALLEDGPIAFKPAGQSARPAISAAVASRTAAREVQWRPARPQGASLVRMAHGEGVPAGTLAWFVALKPRHPLYDGAGSPAANYTVAFIRADDGRLLGDAAGYSPDLAGLTPGTAWGMGELA